MRSHSVTWSSCSYSLTSTKELKKKIAECEPGLSHRPRGKSWAWKKRCEQQNQNQNRFWSMTQMLQLSQPAHRHELGTLMMPEAIGKEPLRLLHPTQIRLKTLDMEGNFLLCQYVLFPRPALCVIQQVESITPSSDDVSICLHGCYSHRTAVLFFSNL